ncbi:glycosyltransferase family 2 protein [Lachnoclostridium sp.]|nr:glycosyltransferase [Lachnoclostridium sp.]
MSSEFIKQIVTGFNYIVFYYVLAINTIYFMQLIMSAFGLYDYIRKMHYSDYKKYTTSVNMIPISVLVPAYNEENTIVDNIKSLLALNYPSFEVIVINDGSQDNTFHKIVEAYNLKEISQPVRHLIKTKSVKGIYKNLDIPNLILVDKENGGKADALNVGINISKYPVFTTIDADSILESDSLVRVIMPFIEDHLTVAVGGIVRIANGSKIKDGKVEAIGLPKSNLAMFQIVEYLRAFLTGRLAWSRLGCLLIISGAFGAFQKEAVVKAGGYASNTIGEDMELVVKIHKTMRKSKSKYKIKFIPDPVCWTQAPEKIKDLRGQRRRWQIGLMDSLFKNKELLLNPRYGIVGMFGIPFFWIFEMLGPIIETLGYIIIPLSYVFGLLNTKYFVLFLIASILYGVVLSIGAILLEEYTFSKYPSVKQLFKLSWYGILENFGYRQMTTIFRMDAIIRFKKFKNDWGNIKRESFSANKEENNKSII